MKASELYQQIQKRVDELQKAVKNNSRDQLTMQCQLENVQVRQKQIMQSIITQGDHDLTEAESIELGVE